MQFNAWSWNIWQTMAESLSVSIVKVYHANFHFLVELHNFISAHNAPVSCIHGPHPWGWTVDGRGNGHVFTLQLPLHCQGNVGIFFLRTNTPGTIIICQEAGKYQRFYDQLSPAAVRRESHTYRQILRNKFKHKQQINIQSNNKFNQYSINMNQSHMTQMLMAVLFVCLAVAESRSNSMGKSSDDMSKRSVEELPMRFLSKKERELPMRFLSRRGEGELPMRFLSRREGKLPLRFMSKKENMYNEIPMRFLERRSSEALCKRVVDICSDIIDEKKR